MNPQGLANIQIKQEPSNADLDYLFPRTSKDSKHVEEHGLSRSATRGLLSRIKTEPLVSCDTNDCCVHQIKKEMIDNVAEQPALMSKFGVRLPPVPVALYKSVSKEDAVTMVTSENVTGKGATNSNTLMKTSSLEVIAHQITKASLSLTWDALHQTNIEHCYCYCGGPGEWYMKMLQCRRCRQWFHEECLQCLKRPLVNGDGWFIFVCSLCNAGLEYLKRLDMNWVDIAQLCLFNLTLQSNTKYSDLIESMIPWVMKNWDNLQLSKFDHASTAYVQKKLHDALESHKTRFQCGREIRKRTTLWALRVELPPPPPTVILPVEGKITEDVMNKFQMKGRKTKSFVPLKRKMTETKSEHGLVDPVDEDKVYTSSGKRCLSSSETDCLMNQQRSLLQKHSR